MTQSYSSISGIYIYIVSLITSKAFQDFFLIPLSQESVWLRKHLLTITFKLPIKVQVVVSLELKPLYPKSLLLFAFRFFRIFSLLLHCLTCMNIYCSFFVSVINHSNLISNCKYVKIQ